MLAYEDEMSWKSVQLEHVSLRKDEWWAHDLVHFTDMYIKREIKSPVGVCDQCKYKVISKEELAKDFYDHYTVQELNYLNARGQRPQSSGFIAEMMDPLGSSSVLFVTNASQFNHHWSLLNQQLYIFDNKCGAPIVSPDGKFVVFLEEDRETAVIHKLDFISDPAAESLKANEININEVLFDERRNLAKKVSSSSAVGLLSSPSLNSLPSVPSSEPPEVPSEKKQKEKQKKQLVAA
jgi:hypothetical protein